MTQKNIKMTDTWYTTTSTDGGYNLDGTMPKIVECGICNEISIEKESRSSDVTCSTCGRNWFRENKPNLVRD